MTISAHSNGEIAAIACNAQGTLIASASERGHIIKIFNTDTGDCVQELKRGNVAADISQIVFHPSEFILACATKSNPTVHLFETSTAVEKCIELGAYGFSKDDLARKDEEEKNSKQG